MNDTGQNTQNKEMYFQKLFHSNAYKVRYNTEQIHIENYFT